MIGHSTLAKLLDAGSVGGAKIADNLDTALSDFLGSQIERRPAETGEIQEYRVIIGDSLAIEAEKLYPGEGERAKRQFLQYPVWQFADHSSLLYDPCTFVNNLMLQTASKQPGLEYLFSKQCNLLKGITNDRLLVGPALVALESGKHKIFGHSKRFLKRSNIAAIDNVVLDIRLLDGQEARFALPEPLRMLDGARFDSASGAYKFANRTIWDTLNLPDKKKYVPLDENFVSEVLIRCLEQDDPIINRLLFDSRVRSVYLDVKQELLNSEENLILQDHSDFFQYRKGNTLKMAKYDERIGRLYDGDTGTPLDWEFDRSTVVRKLRSGELYADLMFSYIAAGIIPNTDIFGGTSQQEYFPAIKRIFLEVDRKTGLLPPGMRHHITHHDNNKFLGPGLLELSDEDKRRIRNLDAQTDLTPLTERVMREPLRKTIGSMSAYDYFEIFFRRRESRLCLC